MLHRPRIPRLRVDTIVVPVVLGCCPGIAEALCRNGAGKARQNASARVGGNCGPAGHPQMTYRRWRTRSGISLGSISVACCGRSLETSRLRANRSQVVAEGPVLPGGEARGLPIAARRGFRRTTADDHRSDLTGSLGFHGLGSGSERQRLSRAARDGPPLPAPVVYSLRPAFW